MRAGRPHDSRRVGSGTVKLMEKHLDTFHAKVKSNRLLQYFTVLNRVILAISFLPSGMTKLIGYRFTQLPVDTPVGFFFEAIYQTGGWYRFIGLCQVAAAILVLIPRTATLGAAIFFPLVLNIMLITIFVGFTGTWMITSMMFMASLYLICWDYDKFKAILPLRSGEFKPFVLRKSLPFIILGVAGGIFLFYFFSAATPYFHKLGLAGPIIGSVIGGIVGYLNGKYLQRSEGVLN